MFKPTLSTYLSFTSIRVILFLIVVIPIILVFARPFNVATSQETPKLGLPSYESLSSSTRSEPPSPPQPEPRQNRVAVNTEPQPKRVFEERVELGPNGSIRLYWTAIETKDNPYKLPIRLGRDFVNERRDVITRGVSELRKKQYDQSLAAFEEVQNFANDGVSREGVRELITTSLWGQGSDEKGLEHLCNHRTEIDPRKLFFDVHDFLRGIAVKQSYGRAANLAISLRERCEGLPISPLMAGFQRGKVVTYQQGNHLYGGESGIYPIRPEDLEYLRHARRQYPNDPYFVHALYFGEEFFDLLMNHPDHELASLAMESFVHNRKLVQREDLVTQLIDHPLANPGHRIRMVDTIVRKLGTQGKFQDYVKFVEKAKFDRLETDQTFLASYIQALSRSKLEDINFGVFNANLEAQRFPGHPMLSKELRSLRAHYAGLLGDESYYVEIEESETKEEFFRGFRVYATEGLKEEDPEVMRLLTKYINSGWISHEYFVSVLVEKFGREVDIESYQLLEKELPSEELREKTKQDFVNLALNRIERRFRYNRDEALEKYDSFKQAFPDVSADFVASFANDLAADGDLKPTLLLLRDVPKNQRADILFSNFRAFYQDGAFEEILSVIQAEMEFLDLETDTPPSGIDRLYRILSLNEYKALAQVTKVLPNIDFARWNRHWRKPVSWTSVEEVDSHFRELKQSLGDIATEDLLNHFDAYTAELEILKSVVAVNKQTEQLNSLIVLRENSRWSMTPRDFRLKEAIKVGTSCEAKTDSQLTSEKCAYLTATTFMRLGEKSEFEQHMRTFASKYPNSSLRDDALAALGKHYFVRRNDHKTARTYLYRVYRDYRKDPKANAVDNALDWLRQIYEKEGNYLQALLYAEVVAMAYFENRIAQDTRDAFHNLLLRVRNIVRQNAIKSLVRLEENESGIYVSKSLNTDPSKVLTGDYIQRVGDFEVYRTETLRYILENVYEPTDLLEITVTRNGEPLQVSGEVIVAEIKRGSVSSLE